MIPVLSDRREGRDREIEALISRLISKPGFLRYQQVRSAFRESQQHITLKPSL